MEEQSGYLAHWDPGGVGAGAGPAAGAGGAGQEEMMKIADSTHRHQQGGVLARSQTETTIISL